MNTYDLRSAGFELNDQEIGEQSIAMIFWDAFNGTHVNSATVVNLDADVFQTVLENGRSDNTSTILILDNNGNVVSHSVGILIAVCFLYLPLKGWFIP